MTTLDVVRMTGPRCQDFLLGTMTTEDLFLETDHDGLQAEWILGVGVGATAAKLHISKGVQLISRAAIEEMDTTDREVTGRPLLADGRRFPAGVVAKIYQRAGAGPPPDLCGRA